MRILFLHLSDLHIEKKTDLNEAYITEIASALSPASIGAVDKIFVFFTGDIAFSGKEEQYTHFKVFKHSLIEALKQHVLQNVLIHLFLVPGNHDLDYDVLNHSRVECEAIIKHPSAINFTNELKPEVAFLKYSGYNHSLSIKHPLLYRSIIDLKGFTIEVNLLNSTIFSLLHENDQGIHYLPDDIINLLTEPTGANMSITLMHHSHQWFNDSCKPLLEKALLEKNTMVFCGHEHFQATQAISYNGNAPAQFFCGGSLCNRGDWTNSEFFACIYNLDDYSFKHYGFALGNKNGIYTKQLIQSGKLIPKCSIDIPQVRNAELVKKIMNDSYMHLADNLSDYYVFPGVGNEGTPKDNNVSSSHSSDIFNLNDFFAEFEKCNRIEVSGSDTFGKSALLKMVFNHYLASKCVLFCKVEDISSGNRRRIIKSLFEDLYGESDADFQKFERLDKSMKMILIDDIHMINPKHVTSFLSGIEEDFGFVMYTTSNTIKLDIQERIKAAIAKDSYTCFKIHPLYAPKRKELVEVVLSLKNPHTSSADLTLMATRITQVLDLQRRYVPLTPEIIIKFIEYFSTYQMESAQNDGSIFGKVFESSITNALSPHVQPPLTVDKVFMILGKIAYYVHENKRYPITDCEILNVISNYCEEYGGSINAVELINTVLASRIINRCGTEGIYKFCNNNYLAYFVAYEICSSKNTDAIRKCLDNACFGICASILMFITYITNEDSVIGEILRSALSSVENWNEFSFSMKEVSHLNAVSASYELPPPSQEDVDQDKKADMSKDRTEVDACIVDVINIYDYSEDDITKLENQLTRSISLMLLLARCLPNFEHRLKKTQKEEIIKALYTLPNKIFYMWAIQVEQGREELLQLITTMETNAFVRRKPTLEDAQFILQWNSLSLLLDLYHGVVNCAYRENTVEFLTDMAKSLVPFNEETHQLEYLLVLCKSNQVSEFLSIAEQIKDSCKLPAASLSLARVVHHLLLKGKIAPAQASMIQSKFFPHANRSETIYQRRLEGQKK